VLPPLVQSTLIPESPLGYVTSRRASPGCKTRNVADPPRYLIERSTTASESLMTTTEGPGRVRDHTKGDISRTLANATPHTTLLRQRDEVVID
jgi:hypothetical protein